MAVWLNTVSTVQLQRRPLAQLVWCANHCIHRLSSRRHRLLRRLTVCVDRVRVDHLTGHCLASTARVNRVDDSVGLVVAHPRRSHRLSTDRQRVDAFLSSCKKCGFCPPELETFSDMLNDSGQRLFQNIRNNPLHYHPVSRVTELRTAKKDTRQTVTLSRCQFIWL